MQSDVTKWCHKVTEGRRLSNSAAAELLKRAGPFKGKRKVTTQLNTYPELSFDKVIRAQLARALMAEHHTVSACS